MRGGLGGGSRGKEKRGAAGAALRQREREPGKEKRGSGGGGVEAAGNAAKKGEAGERRQEMQPRTGELA